MAFTHYKGATTLCTMTLSIIIQSMMSHTMTTLSIMTLTIKRIKTRHSASIVLMQGVTFNIVSCAECHWVDSRGATTKVWLPLSTTNNFICHGQWTKTILTVTKKRSNLQIKFLFWKPLTAHGLKIYRAGFICLWQSKLVHFELGSNWCGQSWSTPIGSTFFGGTVPFNRPDVSST